MTSARQPAVASSAPSRTARPDLRWGPLVGWLALLAGAVVAFVVLVQEGLWATGELAGRPREATSQDLQGLDGTVYPVMVVLVYVGLVVGTVLGVAAVPATRRQRWGLTAALAVVALVVVLLDVVLGDPIEGRASALLNVVVLLGLPFALTLLLCWRGARRGAAVSALVGAGVAAAAHLVTTTYLVAAPASVAAGAWTVLAAVLVALAGAVLLERTTPRRSASLPTG